MAGFAWQVSSRVAAGLRRRFFQCGWATGSGKIAFFAWLIFLSRSLISVRSGINAMLRPAVCGQGTRASNGCHESALEQLHISRRSFVFVRQSSLIAASERNLVDLRTITAAQTAGKVEQLQRQQGCANMYRRLRL